MSAGKGLNCRQGVPSQVARGGVDNKPGSSEGKEMCYLGLPPALPDTPANKQQESRRVVQAVPGC